MPKHSSVVQKLHIAVAVVMNAAGRGLNLFCDLTPQSGMLPSGSKTDLNIYCIYKMRAVTVFSVAIKLYSYIKAGAFCFSRLRPYIRTMQGRAARRYSD